MGYGGYDGGFGPPPPPKSSKLPVILSIGAIVAIVGTVIAIVLLNRDSDSGQAAGPPSSSARPAPTSKVTPPSSRRNPSNSARPSTGGGPANCPVKVSMSWGLYCVPGDWKKSPTPRPSGQGTVTFNGDAEFGTYACGGSNYFRGFTATGDVQGKDGAAIELDKTVSDFAGSFAKQYYRNPKLTPESTQHTTIDGKKIATLTIKVTVDTTKPDCEATKGEVAVAGVAIEEDGKVVGVRMLVVVDDLAGGPSTPKPLADTVADQILQSLTLG